VVAGREAAETGESGYRQMPPEVHIRSGSHSAHAWPWFPQAEVSSPSWQVPSEAQHPPQVAGPQLPGPPCPSPLAPSPEGGPASGGSFMKMSPPPPELEDPEELEAPDEPEAPGEPEEPEAEGDDASSEAEAPSGDSERGPAPGKT
jgi:hypothetical protein